MKWIRQTAYWFAPALILAFACGCSKAPKVDQARVNEIAKEKVELAGRLADEVAKNPNSVDVAGLVEEFMNTPLDPKAYPAEAAEILKIYEERIKGKIRGEPAQHMQSAVNRLKD